MNMLLCYVTLHYIMFVVLCHPVSEMTYTVSSGTLNSYYTIPMFVIGS